jgi:DNA-binding MarR family transcriptional regulator
VIRLRHCEQAAHGSGPEWLFRDLQDAHRRAFISAFQRCGVGDMGHPMILFILEEFGEDGVIATQKELARRMRLSPTTITISLKTLERQGYVRKVTDGSDLRRNRVEITEAGRQIADKCRAAFSEIDRAMYRGFTPEEIGLISSLYLRMAENLRSITSGTTEQEAEL